MVREVVFTPTAWEDYVHWQGQDPRILERLNLLLRECQRDPFRGIGKPEPLKGDLQGFWSRRIDSTHRLVYAVTAAQLRVVACRYHY